MDAIEFIEKCLENDENPSLFACAHSFCLLPKSEVIAAFINIFRTKYKTNIVSWTPTNPAYPKYMLLGSDKGILAYVCFSYAESQNGFDTRMLGTDSAALLQTITDANSQLDRPVFFVSMINTPDKSEILFETNEQIKDRWLSAGFSDPVYYPAYEEMGDVENLLRMWIDLKKNNVHFH